MKRLIICILLGSLLGCKGFLDEIDQDLLRPETTEHYASLLLNECTVNAPYFSGVHHMTDDVSENSLTQTSRKAGYETIYCWRREIEITDQGGRLRTNETWADLYRCIAILNDVLLEIDKAEGTQEEIDYVKGEAYFLRGLAYFNLVNLYAEPYQPGKENVQLGVPLRLDHGVKQFYNRNTLSECYQQIEEDVLNGKHFLEKSGLVKTLWHPRAEACDLLMSRIKLYQQKWEETVDYAGKVIEKVPLTKLTDQAPFVTAANPEILYTFILSGMTLNAEDTREAGYYVSKDLLKCYDETNDIRRKAFFKEDGDARQMLWFSRKAESGFTELGCYNMRGAETYLNRAEAYIRLNNIAGAQEDLRALIAKRYRDPSKVILPDMPEDLLQFVQDERRREFSWEDNHRWFDLRRMKNRPEIRHVFTYVNDEQVQERQVTFRLLKEDPNYVLPIPLAERENNPMIKNNDRLEKIPETLN